MNPLSKHSQKLVDEFGESAKSHGWNEDQGVGSSVTNAENAFNADKKKLERHIARLEAQVKRYKPTPTPPTPGAEHAAWETAGGTTEEQNEARFAR